MFKTHQIYSACAFTVPPGTPHMHGVIGTPGEVCSSHNILVFLVTSHAVVLAHQIWCASTVPPTYLSTYCRV